MTRPCVYYRHADAAVPLFLSICDDVQRAINLALAVRGAFGVRTWVADWRDVAHAPTAVDIAMQAARKAIAAASE